MKCHVGVLIGSSVFGVAHLGALAQVANPQPFFANISETVYNSDTGKTERATYILHAVRSDRSTVHAYLAQAGTGAVDQRVITLVPEKKRVVIHDDIAAMSTYYLRTSPSGRTEATCY